MTATRNVTEWMGAVRDAARARRDAGTPRVCDTYTTSTVRHNTDGYLCATCAYPKEMHQ